MRYIVQLRLITYCISSWDCKKWIKSTESLMTLLIQSLFAEIDSIYSTSMQRSTQYIDFLF